MIHNGTHVASQLFTKYTNMTSIAISMTLYRVYLVLGCWLYIHGTFSANSNTTKLEAITDTNTRKLLDITH
jgi:hypothetical protein